MTMMVATKPTTPYVPKIFTSSSGNDWKPIAVSFLRGKGRSNLQFVCDLSRSTSTDRLLHLEIVAMGLLAVATVHQLPPESILCENSEHEMMISDQNLHKRLAGSIKLKLGSLLALTYLLS